MDARLPEALLEVLEHRDVSPSLNMRATIQDQCHYECSPSTLGISPRARIVLAASRTIFQIGLPYFDTSTTSSLRTHLSVTLFIILTY